MATTSLPATAMATASMRRNSILPFHQRLFILLLTFSWVVVACFLTFQYSREKQFKVEQVNTRLQAANEQILELLEEHVSIQEIKKRHFKHVPDLRITLINTAGDAIYDSEEPSIVHRVNHNQRPEVKQALLTGSGYTTLRSSNSTQNEYFYSATRFDDLIIRTALPYNMSLINFLKTDRTFLWFMLFITLFLSIIAYLLTRRLGRNIARLREFSVRAGAGEIITATEQFPHDELGDISNQIIRLYSKLQRAAEDRDRERQAALYEAQEKIRIKRELTNNINHELKTPVASICGYIETVLDNPELDENIRKDFLKKSYAQAQRLSSLLRDVTTISKLDETGPTLNFQQVDIAKIISEITDNMASLPNGDRMRVNCNFSSPTYVFGDPALLHSVFQNLTNNAIAYSGGEDIFIRITSENANFYTFSFSDNGSGVEARHLPHLFDRFYRVDKGRSRKLGGTGLGLAIVKNAILQHHGTITVCNGIYGGLQFTFTLPKHEIASTAQESNVKKTSFFVRK